MNDYTEEQLINAIVKGLKNFISNDIELKIGKSDENDNVTFIDIWGTKFIITVEAL